MQERHINRERYFEETAHTSAKYYIPYIEKYMSLESSTTVLEVGCGDGGNLLPFAQKGCDVTGIDLSAGLIAGGIEFYTKYNIEGKLFAANIFDIQPNKQYDLVIVHDVIEHIGEKDKFLAHVKSFLKPEGMMFIAFPAWQMPFGGHQQLSHSKLLSHLPFFHLLPVSMYRFILNAAREPKDTVTELLDIKKCRTSIERFHRLVKSGGMKILSENLYFINPHYEIKFKLKPRRLPAFIGVVPYIRNFFTTSCFYILKQK